MFVLRAAQPEPGCRPKPQPDMRSMFYNASAFNQPIGAWSVAPSLMHHKMFGGRSFAKAPPFCQRGTAPGENNLMCEACQLGQYSDGAYCQVCPPGSAEIVRNGPGEFGSLSPQGRRIYTYICES